MVEIGKNILRAASLLQQEDLVGIPTETVYGLAGNAMSEKAVSKIFKVKNRPTFDPLIVHISKVGQIEELVTEVPKEALRLAREFMPGPLTLLLPKRAIIGDIVTAGSSLVALRIPKHPLTLSLLEKLAFPLAAPSANPFGYISPTTAQHVRDQLGDKIRYILDGGPCKVGVESTIIGFPEGAPTIYRKGGIPVESIERLIGKVNVRTHSTSNPNAPGLLKSHYAPSIPFQIGDLKELVETNTGKRIGIIAFREAVPGIPPEQQIILSAKGNYEEAARRLFAGMRLLDRLELDIIFAELLPEEDLGRAINDRLRRAASREE